MVKNLKFVVNGIFNKKEYMAMSRLQLLLCLLFEISVCKNLIAQDLPPKPNVVLIVANGHGRDDLGCYGSKIIKTPNLDRLAAEGVRMTNAYSSSASSSASRSEILTGMYNHATGQYGDAQSIHHFSVFPEIISLPVYLKQHGYRTGRIGSFLVAPESVFNFDTIMGINVTDRNPYQMADECTGFIGHSAGSPFFLYFCPADPHRSNQVVDDSPYKPDCFGNREEGYPGIIPAYYKPDKMTVPPWLPESPACREELAQYAQAVSRIDLGLGRLFELIRKAGQWDNTLIIYLSDTGADFAGSQNTLYAPGVHLPCIVKPPFGGGKGIACNAMVNWTDVAPTILNFCNALPAVNNFHGRSFKLAIEEESPPGWDEVFISHTFSEVTMYYPMRTVQDRTYKLIWNLAWQLPFPVSQGLLSSATWHENLKSGLGVYGKRPINNYFQRPEFELYNLTTDPHETTNLADNPSYSSILEQMKYQLKNYQVKTNDPWVGKW